MSELERLAAMVTRLAAQADFAAVERDEARAQVAALTVERNHFREIVNDFKTLARLPGRGLADKAKSRSRREIAFATLMVRAEAAEAQVAALTARGEDRDGQIWVKLGECIAGMSHQDISPLARRKIEMAIRAALRTPSPDTGERHGG